MEEKYSIILENHKKLTELCGSNDSNLKLIEKLLGLNVHTIGNEIYFVSENNSKQKTFIKIIEKLEKYSEKGFVPTPDLIKGIYSSMIYDDLPVNEENKNNQIEDLEIIIPGSSRRIYPKSNNQVFFIKNMLNFDINFGVGPAGTGKTFLSIARALSEVLQKRKRKLILTRPVVEAGENLGFLPGDLAQKISPYLRPLYDAMESLIPFELIQKMEETRVIEIAPLAYMRGRSLTDSFVILDEAQNTTKEQMKMFLTRLGEGSKAVITGDITQIDLADKRKSGLIHAVNILKDINEIGFTQFTSADVMRNPLVKKIIDAYEKEK